MEESAIMEQLLNVDKELHMLIGKLRVGKQSFSLDELNTLMLRDRIDNSDSTELIRRMRKKRY
ncbi:hypothetical protein J4207_04305 [Candidatus Woesearchaeota archaeon]|nr:hypothetical protein [Candidatus Woesearchaeota archaeon]